MPNSVQNPSPQNVFILKAHEVTKEQPGTGVRQDKRPQARSPVASLQLQTASSTPGDRKKQHGTEKRQKVKVSSRLPYHVKTEIMRIAKVNGWTESKAVAMLLEQAITQRLGDGLAVLLKQAVTDAVREEVSRQSSRQAKLTFRVLFIAEQIRLMVTNIYRIAVNFKQDKFHQAMKEMKRVAKTNVLQPSPEMHESLTEWKVGEHAGQKGIV